MKWLFHSMTERLGSYPPGIRLDGVAFYGKQLTFFSVTEGRVSRQGSPEALVLAIHVPSTPIGRELESFLRGVFERKKLKATLYQEGSIPVFGPKIYGYPVYVQRIEFEFPIEKRDDVVARLGTIFREAIER